MAALVEGLDRDRHVPLRNHLATWRSLDRAGLHVFHGVGHVPFWEDVDGSRQLLLTFLASLSGVGEGDR